MKKLLLFVSAVAGLFLASCQRETLEPVTGDGTVTITVEAPGAIGTKATIADGENVNEVHYAVYKTNDGEPFSVNGGTSPLAQGVVDMSNKKATVTFDLLQDQEYTVIFWAQVKDAGHYDLGDLREIKIIRDQDRTVQGNDESRAAFFARYDFETYEFKNHDVTLKRPFAQLNLLTTKESLEPKQEGQTQGYTIDVKQSEVLVEGLAAAFNTVDGEGVGTPVENLTYKMFDTPEEQDLQETLTVNGIAYHYVSMNYLFVPVDDEDNALVTVKYEVETDKGNIKNDIINVPIRENYRTNIIGNLLTKTTEFTIIVDQNFDGEYFGPQFVEEPAKNDLGQYVIENEYELAWLAAMVNNTLPKDEPLTKAATAPSTFKGETFVLGCDIDLKEFNNWTPIGASGLFEGTFDGQEHTISNLTVKTEGKASAGLFANCRGYIKNLNLVNVNITGQYKTGAVVGDGLCAKIENCHVDGLEMLVTPYKENEANNVGGIVGYLSAEPTAYVKNCSVKNANITAYRKVGGIVGAANGKSEVTGNSIESSVVTADQTSEYNEVKPADAGAVVGWAHADAVVDDNDVAGGINTANANAVKVIVKIDDAEDINANKDVAVVLPAGTYTFTETVESASLQVNNGNDVTINANDNTLAVGTANAYGFVAEGEGTTLEINDANIDSKGGAIGAVDGAKVTVNNSTVAVNSGSTSGRYNVYAVGEGTEVTINGGVFSFSKTLNQKRAYIYCGAGATVYVKGGKFGKASTRSGYTAGILGDGKVIITGGTFGFDPTKWVAYGYTAKKVGENWVVVAPAANNDEFQEALKNAKAGDVIYIAGTGVLPSSIVTSPAGELTIEGVSEDAEVSFNTKAGGADGGLNCYADGMDLVFKNVKVVSPNTGSAYTGGFGRAKSVLFDNCEYYGQYRSLSYVKFNQCTIDPQTSYIYTDYSNADFVNCVFNCSEGKGIQVYNDGNSTETTINVTKCTFEAAKHGATWDGKPVTAIDINSNGEKFIVNITETTATGFPVGLTTGYSLFNIKGGAEYVTVYVDGNKYIAEGLMEDAEGNQVASTEAGLKEALENGGTVVLANPFTIDQSESNGYGKTGINMTNGGTLDGNGNELGAPGSTGTWDSAINTSGGTIKNIKITKGFRGIFIKKDKNHNEKLYLDNVTIDGTTYTISCDSGNGLGIEVVNSTFKGWTSYAGTLGNAKFTDCYFGKGNGYSYCRPYAPTEFVGCEFEAGFTLDPRAAVTFENCTIGGVALTSENLATLVTDTAKATIK